MERMSICPHAVDLKYDRRRDGWILRQDKPFFSAAVLELSPFLNPAEAIISGEDMLQRAGELGYTAGQRHAEAMLEAGNTVPDGWKEYILLFSGTIWLLAYENLNFPYLYWHRNKWSIDWRWAGDGCVRNDRLVLCRPR